MKNSLKPYDHLAEIYELWCTGDAAYDVSLQFYVNFLKNIEGPFCELGIGTGRIALELSSRYQKEIIGIDESTEMLDTVRTKYTKINLSDFITLIHSDIKDFQLSSKVNAIYLPFRTIGHIIADEDVRKMLSCVYNSLTSDGYFIFDHYIFSKEWAESHNKTKILMYQADNLLIEDYYIYDFENHLMDCSIFVNGYVRSTFSFSYHDPSYYIDLLNTCGFYVETLLGEFDGSTYDKNSFNQIYICRKKISYKEVSI